jgi:hypothetical protein
LQQGKQRGGVRVEHTKRTENNDARSAKALIAEGSKVDQRIREAMSNRVEGFCTCRILTG